MEINGVKSNRNRQSQSPDLLAGMFTPASVRDSWIAEDDLSEADVFWNATESSPPDRTGFRQPKSYGVLAAVEDGDSRRRILFHKNRSFVERKYTPAPLVIAKPISQESERQEDRKFAHSQSLPCRRVQHSDPVQIPSFSKAPVRKNDEENEILPPHEIVAVKVKTTSSVLEGAGRTLKGRDLAQVRNAVWLQTGFID